MHSDSLEENFIQQLQGKSIGFTSQQSRAFGHFIYDAELFASGQRKAGRQRWLFRGSKRRGILFVKIIQLFEFTGIGHSLWIFEEKSALPALLSAVPHDLKEVFTDLREVKRHGLCSLEALFTVHENAHLGDELDKSWIFTAISLEFRRQVVIYGNQNLFNLGLCYH